MPEPLIYEKSIISFATQHLLHVCVQKVSELLPGQVVAEQLPVSRVSEQENVYQLVHASGGLFYYDRINLKVFSGITQLGDMGFDVRSLELTQNFFHI